LFWQYQIRSNLDLFPKGEATPAEAVACAAFESWEEAALELVDG
jgi:hypothetical protein